MSRGAPRWSCSLFKSTRAAGLETFADPAKKPSACVPSAAVSCCCCEDAVAAVVDWAYGLRSYERSAVPLCPATARLFSRVAPPGGGGGGGPLETQTWQEEAAETFYGFAVDGAMLSGHESYGKFVVDQGCYLPEAEFALYLRQNWVASGKKKKTLPHLLRQFLSEIVDSAAPVVFASTPSEFAERFGWRVVRARRAGEWRRTTTTQRRGASRGRERES